MECDTIYLGHSFCLGFQYPLDHFQIPCAFSSSILLLVRLCSCAFGVICFLTPGLSRFEHGFNIPSLWGNGHPRLKQNAKSCASPPSFASQYCPLRGDIRKNWNDTEKISMAPAQGWHAQIENVSLFLGFFVVCFLFFASGIFLTFFPGPFPDSRASSVR